MSGVRFGGSNPGDFVVASDSCSGVTLAPGQTCSISLRFAPLQTGPRVALLLVADTAAGSPHSVPLVGIGLGPVVQLTAGPNRTPTGALHFGAVRAGTTSAPQTLTLTNTGQTPLAIQAITPSGDFRLTVNTCGSAVAVNSACSISVALAAVHGQAAFGTLTLTDNASPHPQQVRLSGEVVAPSASFSAKSLQFTAAVGRSSAAQQVRLLNLGSAPLSIASITTSGPFTATTNCPITAPSAPAVALGPKPCTITVVFQPTTRGPVTGALTVTDDATGGVQRLPLRGTGQ